MNNQDLKKKAKRLRELTAKEGEKKEKKLEQEKVIESKPVVKEEPVPQPKEEEKKVKIQFSEEFSQVFQRVLILMLLEGTDKFEENLILLRPEYFDNPIHQDMVKILENFYEKYARPPELDEFDHLLKKEYSQKGKKQLLSEVELVLKELVTLQDPTRDYEFVKEELERFISQKTLTKTILDGIAQKLHEKDPDKLKQQIAEIETGDSSRKLEVVSLKDMSKDNVKPRDILVKKWAERQMITLIGGKKNIGKSMFSLNLAISLARGEPFLGEFEVQKPRKVLFIQQEMPDWGILERRDLILGDDLRGMENVAICTTTGKALKVDDSKHKTQLILLIKKHKPDLVILDPYSTFHNKKENSNEQMDIIMSIFKTIAMKYDVGFFITHHYGKPNVAGRIGAQSFRGATRIADAADMAIYFDSQNTAEMKKKVEKKNIALKYPLANYCEVGFELRTDKNPFNIFLELDADTGRFSIVDFYEILGGVKLTPEKVAETIKNVGGHLEQSKVIADLRHIASETTVIRNIKEAVNKGYIVVEVIKAKGKPKVLHIKAGYE